MDDVVGEVVLPISDEDLLAGDAVAAVGRALRLGAQGADVRARLRLGQLHRSHPLAGDQLRQIFLLERVAAVEGERVDRPHGQHRADAERHGGRVPHLDAGGIDGVGQALAAPLFGRRQPVPSRRGPAPVGLLPARRHGDDAVAKRRAMEVAGAVERRDDVACEFSGLLQHCIEDVVRQIENPVPAGCREARRVFQGEGDVGDRCPVGHGVSRGSGATASVEWRRNAREIYCRGVSARKCRVESPQMTFD